MTEWLLVPAAYLVGSVQWGLYIVLVTKRVDIRTVGSGKTGTTNVLRTSGKGAAALVLLADAAKGAVVVLVARLLSDDSTVHALVATAVIVGHIWPVLAGFKGGRGIATGFGTIAVLHPLATVAGLAVFIPVVAGTKYVSLGSVLCTATVMAAVFAGWVLSDVPLPILLYVLACGTLIILMHRDNIRRLAAGTERRIGQKAG